MGGGVGKGRAGLFPAKTLRTLRTSHSLLFRALSCWFCSRGDKTLHQRVLRTRAGPRDPSFLVLSGRWLVAQRQRPLLSVDFSD
jgi:hypothetical protein